MLRVFLSSTFRDLKDDRRQLLDSLNQALSDVGMENFIPDGRTSHEISIEELRKSDTAIFLISPYYGSLIKECKIENCNAICPMKNKGNSISYTHCEYKIALAENKLHQIYIVNKDWEIINELKNKNEIDWKSIFQNAEFKDYSPEEIEHFFKVADLVSQFRDEAGKEMAQYITDINRITSDLANNIVKWYGNNKIDLIDFCGRRAILGELIEKMEESVEVYGVGGIGKTSLVQLGLLIQKLKGKKIIAIATRQSYLTGSGYKHFKDKCAEELHDVIAGKVTLEDVALALGIHENLLGKEDLEKINIILNDITKRNISLFIDDFHLSDDNIKTLVNKANCSIVLASKRKIGLARNEIPLLGIEEADRYNLINLAAKRFHKELDPVAKEKIKSIAEGHPVSTEILVRNFETINFKELENFKKGLNISNPKHSEELLMREVKEILNDKAFLLLKKLSIINTELKSNINGDVIKVIIGNSFISLLNELIDTGMLSKKIEREGTYIFSYRHIQDIIREDKKDLHRWALNYYSNKPLALGEGHADQIEALFHRSKIKPDEELVNTYLELCRETKPSQYGFKRLIDVGKQLKSSFCKNKYVEALILGSVANLYMDVKKFDEARKALRESIKDYRELSRKNRITFRPNLAISLNNMANLYSDLKKFDESEKAYQEALKIKREIFNRDPDKFGPALAVTLNGIASLYKNLNKFDESMKAYQEALKIQKELAKDNLDKFGPELSGYLSNIANIYKNLKKFDESKKAYEEALKIQRELVNKNPDAFGPNLGNYLNNIAGLYRELKKFNESEKAYEEALKIQRELVNKNPDAFGPNLGTYLNNIAGLYRDLKKFDESEKAYKEALKIQNELANKSPDAFRENLASTLRGIAWLCGIQKKYDESEKTFLEALEIQKALANSNPDAFNDDLAETLSGIALLYHIQKRYDESEKTFLEALEIQKALANSNPDAFNDYLASTLNGIANLYRDLKKYDESEKAYLEALEIRRVLANSNPDVFNDDLAETLNDIANLYRDLKKYDESEKAYLEALVIRRAFANSNPDVFNDDLAETLNDIANLYRDLKKYDESEKAYLETLVIRRAFANSNPDAFNDDLATTLNGIGNLYCDLKKYDESEKAYREVLEIRRALAAKYPDIFDPDLAETLNNIECLRR